MLDPQLAKRIAAGKVSHSWLLTGREEQLLPQAKSLAAALLCAHPTPDGNACGVCSSCRKVAADNHPDVQIICPDGASVKIFQTRKMRYVAHLESFEGGRQVVIIHEAHTMQRAAANSLLKILEEPPSGVYFILTAPVGDALLPTILSRVVWIRLLGEDEGEETPADCELRTEMEQKAMELLGLLPGDISTALLFAGGLKNGRRKDLTDKKQTICFLEALLLCLREIWAETYLPESRLRLFQRLPGAYDALQALEAARLVEDAIRLAKSNINTTLLLNVLLLKLRDLCGQQGLDRAAEK